MSRAVLGRVPGSELAMMVKYYYYGCCQKCIHRLGSSFLVVNLEN